MSKQQLIWIVARQNLICATRMKSKKLLCFEFLMIGTAWVRKFPICKQKYAITQNIPLSS